MKRISLFIIGCFLFALPLLSVSAQTDPEIMDDTAAPFMEMEPFADPDSIAPTMSTTEMPREYRMYENDKTYKKGHHMWGGNMWWGLGFMAVGGLLWLLFLGLAAYVIRRAWDAAGRDSRKS